VILSPSLSLSKTKNKQKIPLFFALSFFSSFFPEKLEKRRRKERGTFFFRRKKEREERFFWRELSFHFFANLKKKTGKERKKLIPSHSALHFDA